MWHGEGSVLLCNGLAQGGRSWVFRRDAEPAPPICSNAVVEKDGMKAAVLPMLSIQEEGRSRQECLPDWLQHMVKEKRSASRPSTIWVQTELPLHPY
jgi:hypothetical protein